MVQGQKTVKLMSPAATAFLYPHSVMGESPNHSQVNFAAPDLQQHPLYPQALQSQQEFVLKVTAMNTCDAQTVPMRHSAIAVQQHMLSAK